MAHTVTSEGDDELRIDFKPPAYSSEGYPHLPQDVIKHICYCLWDDLLAPAVCCTVCRAWYHAAQHVFRRSSPHHLGTGWALELDHYARVLNKPRNRPHGKTCIDLLEVVDESG